MKCYLCNSSEFSKRKGTVRDTPHLEILECNGCGLVTLSTADHIIPGFYENSGMHGTEPFPMDLWLKETEWDDQRRFEMVKTLLPNKRVLDFGCGAAGFLNKVKTLASDVIGVELESRVKNYWNSQIEIVPSIDGLEKKYDLITAFHVIEHLQDPRSILKKLGSLLSSSGRLVIEVPSAEDALLTLYDCDPFQRFTYWSQHLFLYNSNTLETLAKQAELRVVAIQHYQRYPLSNHLFWLSKGKPAGHQIWSFLDNPELTKAYSNTLASIGKTDTLIAHLEILD